MGIVFCGKTGLWLWRSAVRIGGALDVAQAELVVASCEVSKRAVNEAVWKVNALMGGRWFVSSRPEVVGPSGACRRPNVRVRTYVDGMRVHPLVDVTDVYVLAPEECLAQSAVDMDVESCALLGLELCGTYGAMANQFSEAVTRVEPRVSAETLKRRAGGGAARQRGVYAAAMQYIADGAASPMEARLYLMFTLPRRSGGLGLPPPTMNGRVELDAQARRACGSMYLKPDFLWEDIGQVVEYDSTLWHFGRNNAQDVAARARRDRSRINALQSMGYTVWSMTSDVLGSRERFETFMNPVVDALGVRRSRLSAYVSMLGRDEFNKILCMNDPLAGVFGCVTN